MFHPVLGDRVCLANRRFQPVSGDRVCFNLSLAALEVIG